MYPNGCKRCSRSKQRSLALPKPPNRNERLISLRSRYNLRAPVHNGLWLSLVERHVRDVEAVGSNPTSPIRFVHRPKTQKPGEPLFAPASDREPLILEIAYDCGDCSVSAYCP